MQDEIFMFARDVAKSEWAALQRDYKKGEKVIKHRGHDYGLVRDDAIYCKRETVMVYNPDLEDYIPVDPEMPQAFTVPVEFLVDENGHTPLSDYWVPGRRGGGVHD